MKPRFVFFAVLAIACAIPVLADDCPPGASWCSGLYRYDAMGNVRAIGSDTYIYDTAGRLVSGTAEVQRGGTSRQDYTYDTFGNRIGAGRIAGSVDCLGGCEQSPAIDPATNHITSNGALYDAAGNLIAIQNTANGVTWSATYTYDAAGSLARATAGSDDRQFIYTADDERIATRNGQNWTWTVRDLDNNVLREFTSLEPNGQPGLPTLNRQWAKDYIWRDGLLLASVVPTTPGASTTLTQHFHLDHLGTPRLVSNDAGVQIGIHAYYPFGAELNLSGETSVEPMKFTGHERDLLASNPNTLDYMHARYDSATMGRFLSVDPMLGSPRWPQTWNRYSYVLNNPITATDPTGRCGETADFIGPRQPCDMNFKMAINVTAKTPNIVETVIFITKETNAQITPFGLLPNSPAGMWKSFQDRQFLNSHPDWQPPILGSPVIFGGIEFPNGMEPSPPTALDSAVEWWTPSANEVRVSRWMSQDEAAAMKSSGTLQVGADGRTYVTALGAPKPGGTGPVRVDFNVPRAALQPAGNAAWYQIFSPARPPVTGIVVHP